MESNTITKEELEKYVEGQVKEVLVGLTTTREQYQVSELQGLLYGLKKITVNFDLKININLNFNYIYHTITKESESETEKASQTPI